MIRRVSRKRKSQILFCEEASNGTNLVKVVKSCVAIGLVNID